MNEVHQIKVPQLGEGIHRVKVVRILKETGDWVEEDGDLIEVETDKATYEVPTPAAGFISNILCKEGDVLDVGENIVEIGKQKTNKINVPQNNFGQSRKGNLSRFEDFSSQEEKERKLPRQQLELIERLHESQDIVVPATIEKQINWDQISEIRKLYRENKAEEIPSSLEIITYAVSQAMFEYEKFRAKLHYNSELEISKKSSIGIAVSLADDVLVTPAVVFEKSCPFEKTAKTVRETIKIQKEASTPSSQYHSLTLSDMSSLGITSAQPVIVYPAIATLFVGSPYQALNKDGQTYRASNFILTFDHRLMNGAYAAKFLNQIEKNIRKLLTSTAE